MTARFERNRSGMAVRVQERFDRICRLLEEDGGRKTVVPRTGTNEARSGSTRASETSRPRAVTHTVSGATASTSDEKSTGDDLDGLQSDCSVLSGKDATDSDEICRPVVETAAEKIIGFANKMIDTGRHVSQVKPGTKHSGYDVRAAVRGVLGIVDMFTAVPIVPLFDAVVDVMYGSTTSESDQTSTEQYEHFVDLFQALKEHIQDLEGNLLNGIDFDRDMNSIRKYSAVIDLCSSYMELFLKNRTAVGGDKYREQFRVKANEVETVLFKLMSIVTGNVHTSIMELQYRKSDGRVKPVAELAYVIHVTIFRAMICLQVCKVDQYGQENWQQVAVRLNKKIVECYAKINRTLQRCKEEVEENMERDLRAGMKTIKENMERDLRAGMKTIKENAERDFEAGRQTVDLDEVCKKLRADYGAIVHIACLEVDIGRSYSGWGNARIYRAESAGCIYHDLPAGNPEDEPISGVVIFYWPVEDNDTVGNLGDSAETSLETIDAQANDLVDELVKSCRAESAACSRASPRFSPQVDEIEFQYLVKLSVLPSSDMLACKVVVVDHVTGYRRHGFGLVSTTDECQQNKWKFHEKLSTKGSVCLRKSFDWQGIAGQCHRGVACIARKVTPRVEDCIEVFRNPSNGQLCRTSSAFTIFSSDDVKEQFLIEKGKTSESCILI